ncbi:MAG: glycoside hydrolase family 127 protein, partial [bacterium]|nr:glycoside hydrolase family 127 protein [bacterium]
RRHYAVQAKMSSTGGIGPASRNEGFTDAHDLPNDTAYAETCASIGMVLWAHRLNLLHADARYVDVLERVLCNGLLSGVSLNGEGFFYTNPLASRGKHHRRSWYKCACCPPNIARIMLSLGGYVYARTDRAVFVNLYMGSRAKINLAGTTVSLTQQTRYPWDGQVKLTVEPASAAAFELFLRLPAWCDAPRIRVGGEAVTKLEVHAGYVRLRRTWQSGDVVELDLPMPVERIEAHPRVAADTGRVALQRGPIVYCLEAADNSMPVRRLSLPREARLTTEDRPGLLGGVTVITGTALAAGAREWRDWEGALYHPATAVRPVAFVAIPYYAWDNREPGEMVVWLPETLTLVEPPPVAGIVPSASHCFERDTVAALHDRLEPRSSADQTIPRFTWWNRRGSREWVQYDFDQPRRVSGCRVYWFDDRRSGGHCRVPASWKLLYRDGNDWREIPDPSAYGIELDEYNTATFTPVETTALRIEVELQPDFSGGILEWKASEK